MSMFGVSLQRLRPRLPWAPALPMFKRDPSLILPILERLKCDPSLYVRKSVANNINDIAKDHPDIVRQMAAQWTGQHEWTDWIVRRGCRSLIRASDQAVMAFFGYEGGAAADSIEWQPLMQQRKRSCLAENHS